MKQQESSPLHNNEDRVAGQVRLLNEVLTGHLDGLDCPNCHNSAVSVWFTHPSPDAYRTWFICGNCDFQARAQDANRPRFFGEDRLRPDLEAIDASIIERAAFKKPLPSSGGSQ